MEGLSLDPRQLYTAVKAGTRVSSRQSERFDSILHSGSSHEQKEEELKKACTAMESLFIGQMMKAMKKNVKSSFINGGFAEEVFQDMLDNEYSMKMAESNKFGIAKTMYDSLSGYL